MRKLCKKLVTGVLAVLMMLSSVGVSYAMPLWDVETDTSNMPVSSDSERLARAELLGRDVTVAILSEGDKYWFDSSKAKADIGDLAEGGVFLYWPDSPYSTFFDQIGDTPHAFNSKSDFLDYQIAEFIEMGLLDNPHVFVVAMYGTDGSSQNYYFSYYQGYETQNTATASSSAISWKSDSNGWWVERSDGSYLMNEWYQSESGLWYYMGADGYMLTNTTTPDGYTVNADGVWIQ